MTKGGLLLKKQEMTKLWLEDRHVPVTLLKIIPNEVIGYRTKDKDGYDALILGIGKKETNKEKGQKIRYQKIQEFKVSPDLFETYKVGDILDISILEGVEQVNLKGISKGKGFQGVVKRHGFAEGPKTHGSKFHRTGGSIGCRKPRRVNKGKKLPGHMGNNLVNLKNVKIIDRFQLEDESLIAVKGSVPGYYGAIIRLEIQ